MTDRAPRPDRRRRMRIYSPGQRQDVMKKIRWDPEQLSVESIATERDGGAEKGTVRGYDSLRSWV
jgi:hypothetical protein